MNMRRASGFTALLAGAAVLLAACGAPQNEGIEGSATTSPTAAVTSSSPDIPETTASTTTSTAVRLFDVASIEAFPDYPRYLQHKRRLAIATTNLGAETLHVSMIGLRAEHFEILDPEATRATVNPGSRVDIQADFGAVLDCAADASAATAVMEVATESSPTPQQIEVMIDIAPLDEIRDTECGRQRVLDAVDVGFDDEPTRNGDIISTSLRLTRLDGDQPITVTSARGTEIFVMAPVAATGEALPATLEPGDAELVIPVEFSILRCDPHAVGQSTKTWEFKSWIAVGDQEPQFMDLAPGTTLRSDLQQMLDECVARELESGRH